MKSIGADEVVDYRKVDFSSLPPTFDVVMDAVGKAARSACRKLLTKGGKFVSVAGNPKKGVNDLLALKKLIEEGKLKAVIDRTYPLEQVREAHTYVQQFHKKGNVVLKVVQ